MFLFFFLRFYLFVHETHRERQRHRQREKQALCREPDVGLDPGTPGSRLGPKAGAKPLSPTILFKVAVSGRPAGSVVGGLPLAQGVIPRSSDPVPHRAPCMAPASASACVSASLCVSHE